MEKKVKYYINWKLTEVVLPMTDDDVINAKIKELKLLVAKWTATEEEKKELELLK